MDEQYKMYLIIGSCTWLNYQFYPCFYTLRFGDREGENSFETTFILQVLMSNCLYQIFLIAFLLLILLFIYLSGPCSMPVFTYCSLELKQPACTNEGLVSETRVDAIRNANDT